MNFKDTSPANPNFRKAIMAFTLGMPVVEFFGIKFVSVEHGEVVLEMPYRDELSAAKDMLQGGPVGTLIDIAACAAIGTTLPEGWGFSTTDFNTKFVAAASGQRFIAKGQAISTGKTLSVGEAKLYAIKGNAEKLCAIGLATTRNFQLKQA